MINPVFLRTFVYLAQSGHFTRTAEALHMTQPGVSQHVHKLEVQLGVPLLQRQGKRFELTPAGEQLRDYGLAQAQQEQGFLQSLQQDDPYAGECRLACSGAMALKLYPQLLQAQKNYPQLSFALEVAPNQRICEHLLENRYELGIVTLPVNSAELTQQYLGEDELCLVLPRGEASDWGNLMRLGFINHPDGQHYALQLLEKNYPQQLFSALPYSGYINQLHQILLPVSMRQGFTVLPRSAVDAYQDQSGIQRAQLAEKVAEPVYLISKRQRPLAARYQQLQEIIAQQWR